MKFIFLVKIKVLRFIFVFIFSLQLSLFSLAQDVYTSANQVIDYANKVYGNDDILVSGGFYIHEGFRSSGHPYYVSNKFEKSKVYIRNNIYENVLLRYNIEDDEIILKARLKSGVLAFLILNNTVDSILFMGNIIIPASKLNIRGISDGYYEKIETNNFIFLTKYYKTSDVSDYGSKIYSKLYKINTIVANGELTKVNSKKALINYFNDNKKEIKRYLRKNRIDYKTSTHRQLVGLIHYCNDLQNE